MRLLVLRRAHPHRLLRGEDHQRLREHRARALGAAARDEGVGVLHPDSLAVLVLHVQPDRLPDDRLRRARRVGLLRRLRLEQPLLALEVDLVERERLDRLLDDPVDQVEVAVGLLQLGGGDPDLRLGGDGLARLVEHLARVLVRLEAREGEPHVDGVRDALHRAAKHQPRVLWRLQIDGGLPQLDGVGDHLEGFAQHAAAHHRVRLERRRLQPDLDRLRDLLHRLRQHRLGVLARLQPRRLEPHVFVGRARLAAIANHLPRGDQLARHLLEACRGDPAGAVAGVGGGD
mmetsp:Transcript_32016/g.77680  ORF Transcript_32016/g.77680 Transcript_32016/m.77680 type:complete len:288 (+) Transcript_32016:600-1463(+)